MAVKNITLTKRDYNEPVYQLIKNDSKTSGIMLNINRYDGSHDLSTLGWAINITNANGSQDIKIFEPSVGDMWLKYEWEFTPIVSAKVGLTAFAVEAVNADGEKVWQSGKRYINVIDGIGENAPYDPDELSLFQQTISDATVKVSEFSAKLDGFEERVEDAISDCEEATESAETATANAVTATSAANTAAALANTKASKAETEANKATAATAAANTAKANCDTSASAANAAKSDADAATASALAAATSANNAASLASQKATAATTAAATATTSASEALRQADSANKAAVSATTAINQVLAAKEECVTAKNNANTAASGARTAANTADTAASNANGAASEIRAAAERGDFDGTSVTHSWNGTVLTITSASGTSSVDLKGGKGDKGDTYTLTDADKTEIAGKITTDLTSTVAQHTTEIAQQKQNIVDLQDVIGDSPADDDKWQEIAEKIEAANEGYSSLVDLCLIMPQDITGELIVTKLTEGNVVLKDILYTLEEGIRHGNTD